MKKRIVLVSGIFNIVHPGHIRLLQFAKEHGDRLVVMVLDDIHAGSSAHMPESLRLEGVKNIGLVDEAFISNLSVEEELRRLRPDVVVKGKEHEMGFNPELQVLREYGGSLIFSSGESLFSSIELLKKEYQASDFKAINFPSSYLKRHQIEKNRIIELLYKFKELKICVVGDLIVDEYISCEPLGMSQEDPTIVVTPIESTKFLGGAGIVAAHASSIGADVRFISIVGSDSTAEYAKRRLIEEGVAVNLHIDYARPTTLKQRFRCKSKTLLRVSHLHQTPPSLEVQDEILALVKSAMQEIDLLVFSDFNYGCLPQPLVEEIIKYGLKLKISMVADSQSSSQIGDISRFQGMCLITPTEHEARISVRDWESGLVVLAEKLRQQSLASNVFIKMGKEGVLIHSDMQSNGWTTDRIDALNSLPKDEAGAGDSLLIVAAMCIASGGNIWEAAYLGSLAAALQVGRVGNTPIKFDELIREIS